MYLKDTADRANSATLGTNAPYPITEVVGNIDIASNKFSIAVASTDSHARFDKDLPVAHMRSKIVIGHVDAFVANACYAGVCVRYAGGADTCYWTGRSRQAAGDVLVQYKRSAGVNTQIGANTGILAYADGEVLELEIYKNRLRTYLNGTMQREAWDTTITSGTRGGIFLASGAGPQAVTIDSWEAWDLPTPITASGLTGNTALNQTTPLTTASITVPAGQLVLVEITQRVASGTPNLPAWSTAAGVDPDTVQQVATLTNATGLTRTTVFSAIGNGTAATMSFTWTAQTQTRITWNVVTFTNVDAAQGVNGVVQSASAIGTATTEAATLATFASEYNATVVVGGVTSNTTLVAETGSDWAVVSQQGSATTTILRSGLAFVMGADTSPSITGGGSANWVCIGMELAVKQVLGAAQQLVVTNKTVMMASNW